MKFTIACIVIGVVFTLGLFVALALYDDPLNDRVVHHVRQN